MKEITRNFSNICVSSVIAVVLALPAGLAMSSAAKADEADAKKLFKAMSDYLAAQKTISFEYDSTLEVVTKDEQKLALASSGTMTLERPDKFRATRSAGFADVAIVFDAKTLTLLGKHANRYTQIEAPGTIDHLIDELRAKYNRPLPAADLLMSNPYEQLMPEVIDTKDLGSGVVGGVECDFLAFRTEDVDWQIWIAHGERPYPCRYVITSKRIANGPQYTIQFREWKTGDEVATEDFEFKNKTNAEQINLEELGEMKDLPGHFVKGATQ